MKKLMFGAAALALLTGCGQTPGSDAADIGGETAEITVRAGNAALAGDALSAMSLDSAENSFITFTDSSVDGAVATFNGVSVPGMDELVSAGSLVISGLDMTDGEANFGQISLNDITLGNEDEEGEVYLGNIELTNPSPELAAWITDLISDGTPDSDFPEAEQISFDSWSFSGLSGSVDSDEAEGGFGIDSLAIKGVSDLKVAGASISGISVEVLDLTEDLPIKFSLDNFGISNIDAAFLGALQENMDDEEAMLGAVLDTVYDSPMDPGFDGLSINGLAANIGGVKFDMPSLTSLIERNDAGQPVKYVTEPYSMTLSADPDGGEYGASLLQGLSIVGFETIELTGESDASYDPDKDIMSFDAGSNYFALKDGLTLSMGGKIEGYNTYSEKISSAMDFEDIAAGYDPDQDLMTEALGALTFHNLELSIADDSMVNRVLNAIATQSGQDPETLRLQATMGLGAAPMFLGETGVDMTLLTEVTGALSNFISDPGTLTLKLDPEEPLSLATMIETGDPSLLTKDYLGFSATNE